jgi:hypothetical protein
VRDLAAARCRWTTGEASNPIQGCAKKREGGRGVEKRMMGGARDDGVEAARRARSL